MMIGGKTPLHSSASAFITGNESNCGVSELGEKTEILWFDPRVPQVGLFPQALRTRLLTSVALLLVRADVV